MWMLGERECFSTFRMISFEDDMEMVVILFLDTWRESVLGLK